MKNPRSERYSAAMCQQVQGLLRSLSLSDLHTMFPAMQHRGGPGFTLLRLEMRRRPALLLHDVYERSQPN